MFPFLSDDGIEVLFFRPRSRHSSWGFFCFFDQAPRSVATDGESRRPLPSKRRIAPMFAGEARILRRGDMQTPNLNGFVPFSRSATLSHRLFPR